MQEQANYTMDTGEDTSGEVPFNVTEPTDIGDLSDVKEEKQLVPPTRDVKFLISKASLGANDAGSWKWIALDMVIVDGIPVTDNETGETKMGYQNKHMFQNICYFADPSVYTKPYFTKKQHLVQLKYLLNAVGMDISQVKISDELVANLIGKTFTAKIVQVADTIKETDGATGQTKRVKTGEFSNEVRDFKPVSEEDLV